MDLAVERDSTSYLHVECCPLECQRLLEGQYTFIAFKEFGERDPPGSQSNPQTRYEEHGITLEIVARRTSFAMLQGPTRCSTRRETYP